MHQGQHHKYIAILSLLLAFWAGSAAAQNEEDAYYDLPDTMPAVTYALKFDPLQVFLGDFQLYFEGTIAKQWSMEVGLGFTRRDYTASFFAYELDDFGDNVDIQTRYAGSLWLKRYFWDTGELYGPYMALGLLHRRHDKTYNVINEAGELSGASFDDSRSFTSLMLFGGFQAIPMQSNFFCDFYLGAGLRFRDFDMVRSTDSNDPDMYSVSREQSWVGALHLGIKFGIGF